MLRCYSVKVTLLKNNDRKKVVNVVKNFQQFAAYDRRTFVNSRRRAQR